MSAEPVLERIARVEGRVEEHSRMVEDIAGRFTNLESRFDRAEANNAVRFDHLEARLDARFDRLDEKIDEIRNGLDGRVDGLDAKMTSYFTWMIGLTLASWLSLMYQFSRVR